MSGENTPLEEKPALTLVQGGEPENKPLTLKEQIAEVLKAQKLEEGKKLHTKFNQVSELSQEIEEVQRSIEIEQSGVLQDAFREKISNLINSSIAERDNLVEDDQFKIYAIGELKKSIKKIETIKDLEDLIHKANDWYKVAEIGTKRGYRNGEIRIGKSEDEEVQRKMAGLRDSFLSKLNYLREKNIELLIDEVNKASENKIEGLKTLDAVIDNAIDQKFLYSEQFDNGTYRIFSTEFTPSRDDNTPTVNALKKLTNAIFAKYKSYKQ
ncbi:hypothetical protein KKD70_01705 [Patescibacteria group bacterium]|nr:hypothetical protein [Patescibacteria group bacterium]